MPGKDFDEKLALLQVRHHKSSQFFFLSFLTLSIGKVQIYLYYEKWVEIFLEKVIKWEDINDAIDDLTEKKRRGEERRKEERRGVDKIISCRYIDHVILACKLPSIFFCLLGMRLLFLLMMIYIFADVTLKYFSEHFLKIFSYWNIDF